MQFAQTFAQLWIKAKKRKKIILAIFILLVMIILYESDNVMIRIPQNLFERIHSSYGIDLSPQWTRFSGALFRLEDDINIFRFKRNLLDGTLPVYSIQLSSNDLRYFDNVSMNARKFGTLSNDFNGWRAAKLSIGSNKYKIKIRLHGDSTPHWANELKSYAIKTDKEDYIDNIRRFNLLLFEDRFFTARVDRFLSKLFGLHDVRDNFVVLQINGVMQGVYYLQEKVDDTGFLEHNECSNCFLVRISDNWVEDHPYNVPPYYASDENGIVGIGHLTPFDYELANLNEYESLPESKGTVQYKVNQLFNLVNSGNTDAINYFDMNQLSSFEAARMIIGNVHVITGDNFHTIYRSTNGKFYPLLDTENIYPIQFQHGSFEHYLNTFGGKPVKLFYLLYQNDELRYLRNQKVYNFIMNNTLSEYYDSLLNKYGPYVTSYKTNSYSSRIMKYLLAQDKETLEGNMAKIRKNLQYAKAYLNVVEKANNIKIELIPDSIAQLKFSRFKLKLNNSYSGTVEFTFTDNANNSIKHSEIIENETNEINLLSFVNELYFFAGMDENLYPEKRYYHFNISFPNTDKALINSVDVGMQNDVTKAELPKGDIYLQIADGNDYYDVPKYFSFESFKEQYPDFKWSYDNVNNKITLLQGDYTLNEDMLIPKTNGFSINAGVTIAIAENKSIFSYSPLNIIGTKERPVTIRAADKNKPFGVFAVVGDLEKKPKSTISWFDISGGNQRWINGLYFSGQFAIYHMNVTINHSSFHGSHSDDGINIKYSNVLIDDSKFYDNNADQVDFDFVTGVVENSDFNGLGDGDSNGDGLDLSGSTLLVKNNRFYDSPDKGISIGEKTRIMLFKNQIYNNNLGVAVKDLSEAYFVKNKFVGNKIAIDSYQKKPLFGGGTSYLYENVLESNDKNFQTDKKSTINNLDLAQEKYNVLANELENDMIIFPVIQK